MNTKQLTEVVVKLKSLGYVDYDKTVPTEILEDVLKIKYCDDWTWRGPMLSLRGYLSDMGYFISERGLDEGSIRFLSELEIPEHILKRRHRRYHKMDSDLRAAMRLPTHKLGDKQLKILNHEQDRLSRDISSLAESDPELRQIFCET